MKVIGAERGENLATVVWSEPEKNQEDGLEIVLPLSEPGFTLTTRRKGLFIRADSGGAADILLRLLPKVQPSGYQREDRRLLRTLKVVRGRLFDPGPEDSVDEGQRKKWVLNSGKVISRKVAVESLAVAFSSQRVLNRTVRGFASFARSGLTWLPGDRLRGWEPKKRENFSVEMTAVFVRFDQDERRRTGSFRERKRPLSSP
jgi:hypothetical protein